MAKRTQQFQTIRTEGAILPPDILRRIASLKVDGASPGAYHLPPGSKLNEAISQSWTLLLNHWRAFQQARGQLSEDETGTAVTNEKWLLPLFKELDYGRLVSTKSPEIDERTYPIERFYNHTPIHLVGCNLPLDRRTKGARGAATASPHSIVQEYLNRSDVHLWAFLSNGLLLRILRDNVSLSRQAYVEFDLEAMMQGEVYADFALLWLLCHQSRVESDKPEECWLEKWSQLAREQGTRVLKDLRIGVQNAIEALGRGFIGHPRNDRLREKLRSGSLTTDDYYRQLLRIVYRLLFLFVAEDRELLHPPAANETACRLYDEHYSTRRLRDLALKIRGSKHADLWHALSLIFDALGRNDGRPELGLCGLGSFLWRASSTADLLGPGQPANGTGTDSEPVLITNDDLLQAIRALAYVEQDRTLRTVDYRNMGSEELGSVYESLLELHPVMNADARVFDLKTAAGNERKTSGSYYTPDSLVQCLLDSALEPVVADTLERARKAPDAKPLTGNALRDSQENALLALKVCDPACGSGHFLIAAAHRIGAHLARVRGGEVEPSPADYQHAVRDVIGHCIYGVDINPMAVELCKVALWMEALEPGKPLSFLDHRIQCGNSLLGVTPALLAKGIPDEAFEPIEGDDKVVCRELKRRNKDERKGQGQLWDAAGRPWERLGNLATAMVALDSVADDTLAGVQDKQRRWQELVQSSGYLSGRLLADAWCAAFVWKKTREMGDAVTESVFRRIERNPHDLTPWMRDEIRRLTDQFQFIHWHLVFPDVFRVPKPDEGADNEQTGLSGGFDVVLGNPPWERVKFQDDEFFATRDAIIANETNAARRRTMISSLPSTNPELHHTYIATLRESEAASHFLRNSACFPYCGRGDVNTYSVFAELFNAVLQPTGRSGIIVPSGIVTDLTTSSFFAWLIESGRLASAFDFENRERILFPTVYYRMRFCLLTTTGPATRITAPDFVFLAYRVEDLGDPARHFSLTAHDIALVNPGSKTCPMFLSRRDAETTLSLYRSHPTLGCEAASVFEFVYRRIFDMSTDAAYFHTDSGGMTKDTSTDNADAMIALYEGRMFDSYNHRAASMGITSTNVHRSGVKLEVADDDLRNPLFSVSPRYWVQKSTLSERLGKTGHADWFIALKDITSATNARTVIAAIIPYAATGNTSPVLTSSEIPCVQAGFLAMLNSFVFDYAARRKVSGNHLTLSVLEQLPSIKRSLLDEAARWSPASALQLWLAARSLELSFTGWDLAGFAAACRYHGPPFVWDLQRRLILRSELDAAFLHLFGLSRDDAEYILQSFRIVRERDEFATGRFTTRDTILSIYDEMAEAIAANEAAVAAGRAPIAAYQTRLSPPPGPPADAAGNFLPLPEWKPGQPRPANWPRHIHAPREVHEWAVANGIDWRTLLEPLGESNPTVLG